MPREPAKAKASEHGQGLSCHRPDNPPAPGPGKRLSGRRLLLCTQKDHALVEYALAGMDSSLFVSKYQLELPSKEDLQRFLEEKRREMNDRG
jgi:hypothetical protein